MTEWVVLGRVAGLYGLRGWVKVFSYTEPREGISEYNPLYLKAGDSWREYSVLAGRAQGKSIVISFKGIEDRDNAATLIGCDIAINRSQLPDLEPGEFYWSDLQGLSVVTTDGADLGTVDYIFATGANDVVVVKDNNGKEHLIPFLRDEVILDIDLAQQRMQVDWDPDF